MLMFDFCTAESMKECIVPVKKLCMLKALGLLVFLDIQSFRDPAVKVWVFMMVMDCY